MFILNTNYTNYTNNFSSHSVNIPFSANWNARKCLWNSPLGLIGTRVSAYGTISLGTLYQKSTALKAKVERAGAISKFAKRFRDLCGKKAAGRVWAMRVHQEGRNDLQLSCSWADFRFRAPHSSEALWGPQYCRHLASALPKNQRFSGAPKV